MSERGMLLFGVMAVFMLSMLGFLLYQTKATAEAHAHELRKIYVERCQGTPEQAERAYPVDVPDAGVSP